MASEVFDIGYCGARYAVEAETSEALHRWASDRVVRLAHAD